MGGKKPRLPSCRAPRCHALRNATVRRSVRQTPRCLMRTEEISPDSKEFLSFAELASKELAEIQPLIYTVTDTPTEIQDGQEIL